MGFDARTDGICLFTIISKSVLGLAQVPVKWEVDTLSLEVKG
jgi:hypothetical protein